MGKQPPIHVLSMLLLILATYVSAKHYYIVVNYSTCKNYSAGTCFTLADFAMNISRLDLSNNLTLSFFPGEHLLMERLTIDGPQKIALIREDSSYSSTPTIKCHGTSGFEFGDIQSLNIVYLEFTGCGNVSYGGAIFVNRAKSVLVKGCHFMDNHVTDNAGGAIHVENTVTMKIEASFFSNNFASALSVGSVGGAIIVNKGSIFTVNSHYINNSAGYAGGAIYVSLGNINSTSDYYKNNSAGYAGGAICVHTGNMHSTSDQYINNAGYAGGAILVFSGNIYSTSDQYINNSANYSGGAIVLKSGSIYTTSDMYLNNSADYGGAISVFSGHIYSTVSEITTQATVLTMTVEQ